MWEQVNDRSRATSRLRGTIGAELGDLLLTREVAGDPRLRVDRSSRSQIEDAARLLRSIRPADGELEIALHEIARRLERMAETGKPCRPHGGMFKRVLDSLSA